jgi:hypothetical protein
MTPRTFATMLLLTAAVAGPVLLACLVVAAKLPH